MTTDASWTGSMPEIYDRCLGPALFEPYAAHLAPIAAALDPQDVLELAAGTGVLTAELVGALPNATVTATDLNPAMVAWGAERVPGATWATADAQLLDYQDASFDLVICQFGVMFFPDKPAAFAEAARVLRPGGRLLFTTWDAVEGSTFPAAFVESLSTVFPNDGPSFLVRVPHGYYDPAAVSADVTAGGLDVERVERVVLPNASDSARTIAEGFCLGSPLRFDLEAHGQLDEMTAALGDELTRRLGTGPIEGEIAAYVVTARTSTD